jgi:hypothetical protein
VNIREQAAHDFKDILEDSKGGLGTLFTLISKDNREFPLTGHYGDIGYLLNQATGEATQGRTIQAVYAMESLRRLTPDIPEKGWRFKTMDLQGKEISLVITMYEPDRTVGVARIRLALAE